jgi:hypothetical protein
VKRHGQAQMVALVDHLQDQHIKMAFTQMHLEVCLMWLQMLIRTRAIKFVLQIVVYSLEVNQKEFPYFRLHLYFGGVFQKKDFVFFNESLIQFS